MTPLPYPVEKPIHPWAHMFAQMIARQVVGRPSFKYRLLSSTRLSSSKGL